MRRVPTLEARYCLRLYAFLHNIDQRDGEECDRRLALAEERNELEHVTLTGCYSIPNHLAHSVTHVASRLLCQGKDQAS